MTIQRLQVFIHAHLCAHTADLLTQSMHPKFSSSHEKEWNVAPVRYFNDFSPHCECDISLMKSAGSKSFTTWGKIIKILNRGKCADMRTTKLFIFIVAVSFAISPGGSSKMYFSHLKKAAPKISLSD